MRNARRSLLREEWTRGRDSDEPSLEDAVFSSTEILWVVRPDQRPFCLRQLCFSLLQLNFERTPVNFRQQVALFNKLTFLKSDRRQLTVDARFNGYIRKSRDGPQTA